MKPKRKSLGQTPADHKKSRVATARYFDKEAVTKDVTPEETETTEESSLTSATSEASSEMRASNEMEARRENGLAKQGWTGISVSVMDDYQEEDIVIHHDNDEEEDAEDAVVEGETIPVPPSHEVVVQRPATSMSNFFFTSTSLAPDGEFNIQKVIYL